jgi:hypothetical protein
MGEDLIIGWKTKYLWGSKKKKKERKKRKQ